MSVALRPRLAGLELCSGFGGLGLAADLAARGAYATVCHVEREAHSAEILAARMAEHLLPMAPIWSDLLTFDGRPFRGRVDLLAAGLPCQPYSLAGSRKGNADERALWPAFVRVAQECQPGIVFIENTPDFLKHAEPVWRHVRELGFEWAPPAVYASREFGSPHIRRRVFLVAAHPDRVGLWEQPGRSGWTRGPGASFPRFDGPLGPPPVNAGASDADSWGREGEWCGWVFDSERATFRHDANRCGNRCGIGRTHGSAQSPVLRVDVEPASELGAHQRGAVGNGVEPLVAAHALLAGCDWLGVTL